MEPITVIRGTALPIDRSDVDTDQIIPAQYLKRIERTGFGPFLFDEWRKDPDFVMNDPRFKGASILLAGANFGSGSSREHAPWAIEDAGFRAVIAPGFADIFRNNCTKIGLLPVDLPDESVRALMDAVLDDPSTELEVDLAHRTVRAPGLEEVFELDDYTHWRLSEGLDDIDLTLRSEGEITGFEASRPAWLPSATASG
jgi:3-isopropylmalate/(R)-2-methylmalate dehydratase small subunit